MDTIPLSSNTSHVLNAIKLLSGEKWVKTYNINQGKFVWAARQLVQQTLKSEYRIELELDTIYRHFHKLKKENIVEYIKIGKKDCFMLIDKIKSNMIYQKKEIDLSFNHELKNIFLKYSKDKSINSKDEFETFIEYYNEERNIKFYSKKFFIKKWTNWCKRIHRKQDLKVTIHESKITLNQKLSKIASKHIQNKDEIKDAFEQFYLHHESKGTLMSDFIKGFELWCSRWESFKPKQVSQKSQEKQDYRWDFRKAKDVSDKIKDWLEFEKGINWLDDFYWKNIPISGIGWQKVMHPDFNKEEILLYKFDSPDGSYMLEHKTEDILEVEVLQ